MITDAELERHSIFRRPAPNGWYVYHGEWFGKVITTDAELDQIVMAKHFDDCCNSCDRRKMIMDCDGSDESGRCIVICADCRRKAA